MAHLKNSITRFLILIIFILAFTQCTVLNKKDYMEVHKPVKHRKPYNHKKNKNAKRLRIAKMKK